MSDVSEQAMALAEVMFPDGSWWASAWTSGAQRAIDAGWVQRDTLIAELEAQGWTPPPDPWEVIARSVWLFLFPGGEWLASEFESQRNLVQYMRDLHTEDEARAIAKRIEGDDRG